MTEIERLNKRIKDLEDQAKHAEDQSWFALHQSRATEFLLMGLLCELQANKQLDALAFIAKAPAAVPHDLSYPSKQAIADLLRRCEQQLQQKFALH